MVQTFHSPTPLSRELHLNHRSKDELNKSNQSQSPRAINQNNILALYGLESLRRNIPRLKSFKGTQGRVGCDG